MAQTIYVVTSGDYSDYGIRAIFSDKEKAEAYARLHTSSSYSDQYEVEEWPIDADEDMNFIARGRRFWSVSFHGSIHGNDPYVYTVDEMREPKWERSSWGRQEYWVITVEARDMAHAIKIAAEKKAQLDAELAGIA